jgi:hypothetical protein
MTISIKGTHNGYNYELDCFEFTNPNFAPVMLWEYRVLTDAETHEGSTWHWGHAEAKHEAELYIDNMLRQAEVEHG